MSTDLTAERDRAVVEITGIFDGEVFVTDEMESYELGMPRAGGETDPDTTAHPHIVRH